MHPLYGTPIRKVRCFETYAEDAQPIGFTSRQGEHRKYLINAGYAYLELYTDGSKEPRPVKTRDAMREKWRPAPNNVARVYKGDTVLDPKSGKEFVVRQIKAQGGGMLVMTLLTETRPVAEMSAKDGRMQPSGNGLMRFKRI